MRIPRWRKIAAIAAALLAVPIPSLAASVSLIRMTGVPGNSTTPGFTDWVEISDFAAAADYQGGSVDFRPIQVTKRSDETDPTLFEFLVKHANVRDVCVLSYTVDGQGAVVKRSAIGLENAKVTNMTPASTTEGVEQTFTLTYDKIAVISYTYDLGGNPTGQQSYCANAIQGGSCVGLLSCPINN